MEKWNLIIDVEKCENCNNCFLADKDEYCGNSFPGYTDEQPRHGHKWIDIKKRERGSGSLIDVAFMPTMCNSCKDAPCIKAAKNGEIYRREDGIVMIDPIKAKGEKRLVKSCSYGHIWWNEELDVPQKWFFDAHLLDNGWKAPRCVQSCATGALSSVKISDAAMEAKAVELKLETLKPEKAPTLETRPRVWYKNLYRYSKEHVAGSVVALIDNVLDCVEGAEVTLYKDDELVAKLVTDFFGDFKFDGLANNSGEYSITVALSNLSCTTKFELEESVNLGMITLI